MIANMGPWSLLLILILVIVLFGTKKLRNIGSDLGSAIKSFKKSSKEDDTSNKTVVNKNSTKEENK
jgi:sec-independent protein translocase protein TatA